MSSLRLLTGLLIIAALITAGCTGTKTMESLPVAGQSARSDYQHYAGELNDEINDLKNHYNLPENATLDEYRAWLGGFAEKLALCRQMYNNTSAASEKYRGYLNASGEEYANVTADDARLRADIGWLEQAYGQYADYLNVSIKKMAALDEYKEKLNATSEDYSELSGYAGGASINSEDSYARFIDGFGERADAYAASASAAVEAGDAYLQYLEPGSSDYKAVTEYDDALLENVRQCREAYDKYKKDYNDKMGAKSAAQSTFNDYVNKTGKVTEMKKDMDAYRGTAKALEKLDRDWLDGYRKKIDAFATACNDAIAAGNACKQYLDSTGSDYKSIEDNAKNMKDALAAYEENYKKMETTYRNLHPLGSMM
jgi:inorganic pyrophosphatase